MALSRKRPHDKDTVLDPDVEEDAKRRRNEEDPWTALDSVPSLASFSQTPIVALGSINDFRSTSFLESESLDNPGLPDKVTPERIKQFIQRNFVEIKDELGISACKGIAQNLYTKSFISHEQFECIRTNPLLSRKEIADLLLLTIVESIGLQRPGANQTLLEAFNQEGCGRLLQGWENEIEAQVYRWPDDKPLANIEISRRLIKYKQTMDTIVVADILDHLLEVGVLNFYTYQQVKETKFNKSRLCLISSTLLDTGGEIFLVFCNVLQQHSRYRYIGEALLSDSHASRVDSPVHDGNLSMVLETGGEEQVIDYISDDNMYGVDITLNVDGGQDARIIERLIVDENNQNPAEDTDDEELMDIGGFDTVGYEFSSIRIILRPKTKQSFMRLMTAVQKNPLCLQAILQKRINNSHCKRLMTSNCTRLRYSVRIAWPQNEERKCFCKIKKEHLTLHFSHLEMKLQKCPQILEMLCRFDEEYFQDLKRTSPEMLPGELLNRILESENSVHMCLLEKAIRDTGQQDVLDVLATGPPDINQIEPLRLEDISKNKDIFVEELDPRTFIGIIQCYDVPENIMCGKRRSRCEAFVDFLIKTGSSKIVRKFERELKRQEMTFLLNIVREKKASEPQGVEQLHDAIIQSYTTLVDNVEPLLLEKMFDSMIQEQNEKRIFKEICKGDTRKIRARKLLRYLTVTPANPARICCFVKGLEITGQRDILDLITTTAGEYKECSQLFQLEHHCTAVVIRGSFRMRYINGNASVVGLRKEQLSQFGHNDRISRTKTWAITNKWTQQWKMKHGVDAVTDAKDCRSDTKSPVPSSSGVFTLQHVESELESPANSPCPTSKTEATNQSMLEFDFLDTDTWKGGAMQEQVSVPTTIGEREPTIHDDISGIESDLLSEGKLAILHDVDQYIHDNTEISTETDDVDSVHQNVQLSLGDKLQFDKFEVPKSTTFFLSDTI